MNTHARAAGARHHKEPPTLRRNRVGGLCIKPKKEEDLKSASGPVMGVAGMPEWLSDMRVGVEPMYQAILKKGRTHAKKMKGEGKQGRTA